MPSPNDVPGEIKRNKFLNALQRVGFVINKVGGNGSHYKAIWPSNNKSVTIPQNLPKLTVKYILKEIEECSGVTWENIREAL